MRVFLNYPIPMLSEHDLAALLADTGVTTSCADTTDDTAIWFALMLIHGLVLAGAIRLFFYH